jgi:cell division protein FtsL
MTTERELREREWKRQASIAQKRSLVNFFSKKRSNILINILITAIFLLSLLIAVKNSDFTTEEKIDNREQKIERSIGARG